MMGKKGIIQTVFIWVIIVCAWLICMPAQAQPQAEATLEPKEIQIGEWARLKVEVKHHKALNVFWPSFEGEIPIDSARYVEIVQTSPIDTLRRNDSIIQSRVYSITAWDSGFYIIPPINFTHQLSKDDSLKSAKSYPVLLTVSMMPVDTTQAIKPIKDPMDMPFQLSEIKNLLIGIGLAVLLLMAIVVFLVTRKRKPAPVVEKHVPTIPPHELALQRLRELERKKYWQAGEPKKHHSGITETLREYLDNRYGFYAQESTTEEIINHVGRLSITLAQQEDIGWIFRLADQVKFAKVEAYPDEHIASLKKAIDFVNQTKQLTQEEPQA